jgi:hypothetical protein
MTIAIFPLLVGLTGLLMWIFGRGKVAEIGKIMFFCGLLAFCMASNWSHRL